MDKIINVTGEIILLGIQGGIVGYISSAILLSPFKLMQTMERSDINKIEIKKESDGKLKTQLLQENQSVTDALNNGIKIFAVLGGISGGIVGYKRARRLA
jgi:hypothetical protein